MSSVDHEIKELRGKVERLLKLLNEPQPGLFTWWEAVARLKREVGNYGEPQETNEPDPDEYEPAAWGEGDHIVSGDRNIDITSNNLATGVIAGTGNHGPCFLNHFFAKKYHWRRVKKA